MSCDTNEPPLSCSFFLLFRFLFFFSFFSSNGEGQASRQSCKRQPIAMLALSVARKPWPIPSLHVALLRSVPSLDSTDIKREKAPSCRQRHSAGSSAAQSSHSPARPLPFAVETLKCASNKRKPACPSHTSTSPASAQRVRSFSPHGKGSSAEALPLFPPSCFARILTPHVRLTNVSHTQQLQYSQSSCNITRASLSTS